jgi:hypothetical protein
MYRSRRGKRTTTEPRRRRLRTLVLATTTGAVVLMTAVASTSVGPALAGGGVPALIGTWEQVVHHPSPPVDHPMHRSRISFHPDGTVTDSSPHGVALGLWRWTPAGSSTFEFIIDEHQYSGVDLVLVVIPHCRATFVTADRWTGTCTAGLFTPDGVRIALVPGNTIEGSRLQFPSDF